MISQIRSEAYKLATTRTNAGIAAAIVGLVSLAVLLHAFGLPVEKLGNQYQQRGIFIDVGVWVSPRSVETSP